MFQLTSAVSKPPHATEKYQTDPCLCARSFRAPEFRVFSEPQGTPAAWSRKSPETAYPVGDPVRGWRLDFRETVEEKQLTVGWLVGQERGDTGGRSCCSFILRQHVEICPIYQGKSLCGSVAETPGVVSSQAGTGRCGHPCATEGQKERPERSFIRSENGSCIDLRESTDHKSMEWML